MREITRIHIAKIAYDIEIDAKKDIEKYIGALEHYADDAEILGDIEIRITELLMERGVMAGGVITADDVAAVRAQLGEPSEFASEDIDHGVVEHEMNGEQRRVYRDTDTAIVGGVLSGFARFFGIDPLWVRVVFIVLLFASAGTALIIYLILWLIIPPAHTAAEKLRMSGRAVTLASIKELAGTDEQQSKRAQVVRKVLSGVVGSILILMAIAGLLAIAAVVFGVQFGFGYGGFAPITEGWVYDSWWFMAMMGLFVVSGLLFSALCFILASAVFHRKWTKRTGVAVVAIIAAGLVVFASGIGAAMYGYASEQARIAELRQTTTVDLPANFKNVKKLTLAIDGKTAINSPIHYHVSDKSYYELETLPGIEPSIEISDDGLSATVKLIHTDREWSPWDDRGKQTWRPWYSLSEPTLNVYGPALDSVEAATRTASYSNDTEQPNLTIVVRSGSKFGLFGTYDSVHVTTEDTYAKASLENATISGLHTEGGGIMAGVVRILDVKQADVCAGRNMSNLTEQVRVRAVSGGKLIYNGKEEPAETISRNCGTVVIGPEYYIEDWEW